VRKIFLVFIFFIKILYSQDNTEITIRSIKFEGLKRTRNSTMFNILSPINNGTIYTSSTTNDIIEKLNSEHIFQPDITFDTVYEDNYVDITVYVKDRWTLVPVPMLSFSDSSWYVGLYLFEKNLFGFNKNLNITGYYGSHGWGVRGEYKDKKFLLQNLNMNIILDGGESVIADRDIKNDSISRMYQNIFLKTDILFKYQLLPELSLGGGIKYEYYDDIENKISRVEKVNSLGPYIGMEYKKMNYEYPFEEGVAIRFNSGYQFSLINNENYYSINGEVNASYILTEIQRIGGAFFLGHGDLPAQKEFRLGGKMGTYTLPQSVIAADYYSSVTAFYEIAFLDLALRHKKSFATLAVQIFYEGGLYGSEILDNTWHHGPGFGVFLYTPLVSLPAVEFRFAYDIVSKNYYFRVGLSRYL